MRYPKSAKSLKKDTFKAGLYLFFADKIKKIRCAVFLSF